jgi:hypothetical protein
MRLRAILTGLALLGLAGVGLAQEPAISLKKVKYDELARAITQHKGKVVLVEFWATY